MWRLILALATVAGTRRTVASQEENARSSIDVLNQNAIELFREYIRIDTSHPNPNYTEAVEFWKRQASSLGLPVSVHESYAGKPVVVITWEGTNTSLPSIMLNSHMDVVAVNELEWTYPPFEAHIDPKGNIVGRGTQDMKNVGIQYLEAIRRMIADNITLARTVHMVMVPDEEIFGKAGMKLFVESKEFELLNVGFSLDEGMAYPNSTYAVFCADRTPRQILVTCHGVGGHGSVMKPNTAGEKFRKLLDSFMDFRDTQRVQTEKNPASPDGSIVVINLTKISGGIGNNILPTSLSATFDLRVGPTTDQDKLNQTIKTCLERAGCTHEYVNYEEVTPTTSLDSLYVAAFFKSMRDMNLKVEPIISSGTTDMRYLRRRGTPALGFTPLTNVPLKAHDFDEFIPLEMFLQGINIYYKLIRDIANA